MSARAYVVIAILGLIGVGSLAGRVVLEKNFGVANAALYVGSEMLPAAIIFLLITTAIEQYQQHEEARHRAYQILRGEGTLTPTQLLNDLAQGGVITIGNLPSADLTHLQLTHKTLQRGDLSGAILDGARLNNCKVSGVPMHKALMRSGVLDNCELKDVALDESDLTGTLFVDCHFSGRTSLTKAILKDVRFKNCRFDSRAIGSLDPEGAYFFSCKGIDVSMRDMMHSAGGTFEQETLERVP